MKKVVIDVDINTGEAVKGLDEVNEGIQDIDSSTDDLQENTKGLTSSLDKMTGGLITGFKGVVSGVKKGILAMKSLKIAIAATGVGLLLIAFGALITFFTKSQKGMDALSRAFAGFGAAIDVIIDRVIAIGELLSNIFNKPLKETLSGIGDEFKGIGDEIERDVRLAIELERATQRLRDLEIGQSLAQAIRRKEIELLRIASKDLSKTTEERIQALKQALFLENFTLQEQLKNQTERVRIATEEFNRANSTAEDKRAFVDESIRLVDLETESLRRQRTVITELESLKSQLGKEEIDAPKKRVEQIQTQADTELEIIQTTEDAKDAILVDAIAVRNRRLDKDAKDQLQREEILREQQLAVISQSLGAVIDLLGENSAAGKAAAIAQATINTFQGITEVWKTPSILPEPLATISRIASTATVLASGLAAVKSIESQQLPSFASGGAISSASAPQVQAPQFNVVETTGVNQLATSIAQQTQQPIKAFVVAKDVTTQQELDRNTVSTATFGN